MSTRQRLRTFRSFLGRWWACLLYVWARVVGIVADPKDITIISALGYLVGGTAGVYALVNPPSSLEGLIGEVAMYTLASLLVWACLIGLPTSILGEWKIERFALLFGGVAALIYLIIVVVLHYQNTGNRLLQTGFIIIAGLAALARYRHIKDRPIAPRTEQLALLRDDMDTGLDEKESQI